MTLLLSPPLVDPANLQISSLFSSASSYPDPQPGPMSTWSPDMFEFLHASSASSPPVSQAMLDLHSRRLVDQALATSQVAAPLFPDLASPTTFTSDGNSPNSRHSFASTSSQQEQYPQPKPADQPKERKKRRYVRQAQTQPKDASTGPKKRGRKRIIRPVPGSEGDCPEEVRRRSEGLERNRVAAAKCRAKKKDWVDGLEARAQDAEREQAELRKTISTLGAEITWLREQVLKHQDCGSGHSVEDLSTYLGRIDTTMPLSLQAESDSASSFSPLSADDLSFSLTDTQTTSSPSSAAQVEKMFEPLELNDFFDLPDL